MRARYPDDGSVLDAREFALVEGRTTVVFGPNGAGKSTLLRILAGTLNGGPRLESTYLPQAPQVFRGSAGKNLGLGLTTEESARARSLSDTFGFDPELLPAPASTLSGGEVQRLSLARTLARSEPWVLLDEPLAAIDLASRDKAARALATALAGRSAVVVTHQIEDAIAIGHGLIVLVDGRVVQQGSVGDVLFRPESSSVAELVGIRNLLSGVVLGVDGGVVIADVGGMEVDASGSASVGEHCRLVFAAEAVALMAPGQRPPGSVRNLWPGTVSSLRNLGRLIEVTIDIGVPVVALITPGSADNMHLSAGTQTVVSVKAASIHVTPREPSSDEN